MTWTCSRSRRAFRVGSKFFSQSETLPPKAATPTRASASMSPSQYLRSSIILRLSRVRPDSTGRVEPGSSAVLLAAALPSLLRRFASLDRIGHPPAPLGVFSLVADAPAQSRIAGEPGRVGVAQLQAVPTLHPGLYLLVVGELFLVPELLFTEEPRSLPFVRQPDRVRLQRQLVPRRPRHRRPGHPLLERFQTLGRDLIHLLVRPLSLFDHAVPHVATILQPRQLRVDLAVPRTPEISDPSSHPLRQIVPAQILPRE